MSNPTDGYSLIDMQKWVEKCDANIANFEEAITREQAAREYALRIIADLEQKAKDVISD